MPIHDANQYEFLLVDCPPSLGILTMNGLAAVDRVLVPLQCEYFALEGLAVIMRVLKQIKESGANPVLDLEGIVMTMFDGRTNLSQQVVNEVRGHFGEKVFQTVIPRTVRLGEAPSFGKPITAYDTHSQAAVAYRALTAELLAQPWPSPAGPASEKATAAVETPVPTAG
jgi:chromosome partitioning protein